MPDFRLIQEYETVYSFLSANRKHNEAKNSSESPVSSTSLAECDLLTCTEADQSQLQTQTPMMAAEKVEISTKQVPRIHLISFSKILIKNMD